MSFSQEEKLEPDVNKVTDDSRMRLLNKLHAKKEKELKKKFKVYYIVIVFHLLINNLNFLNFCMYKISLMRLRMTK